MVDSNHKGEVVFENVTRAVQTKKTETIILDHCSFVIESGKLTVLIGPSGCGKTTIINLIAGYEKPDRGKVLIDGKPVAGPDRERLVVFQETALFPWLTCYDNVMFGPLATKVMTREEAHEQTVNLLEKVGLRDFLYKYPMQLSGGMMRRAELARALINRPTVMLMDEPFRGLDAMTRELMQEYYLRLVEESHGTHLFVTSEIEEAIFLADRLIIMTNKPSRVKHTLDIDLPRPRIASVLRSKRYIELKSLTLEILHEEAVKASRASGKADIAIESGLRT
ncbi:MAG: ABC transporter ATP-binding protein [Proteobacteria bacterium]|nr:ABC transporter ATP-binding protein [Pseudomonadota bacterium]